MLFNNRALQGFGEQPIESAIDGDIRIFPWDTFGLKKEYPSLLSHAHIKVHMQTSTHTCIFICACAHIHM